MVMLQEIRKLIPSVIKERLRGYCNKLFEDQAIRSYSQEGEDMVLRRVFEARALGFFVDVGAHHPSRFSNTYYFYKLGWRGINIEPNPVAISAFNAKRPRDINIQLGVSDCPGTLNYYQFDEPALNTFDQEMMRSRLEKTTYKLKTTSEVSVNRLDAILAKYLPDNTQIDFMSIDVEGFDLAVLKSNDWSLYRPTCVLVEMLEATLEDVMSGEIYQYMKSKQYIFFAKSYNTLFFLSA